jgi:hypothetical protein
MLLGLLLLAVTLYVSSLHSRGVKGSVGKILNPEEPANQWRYAPLAGATVIVVWHGNVLDNPIDTNSICVRAVRAITDSGGNFSVPGIWVSPSWPMVVDIHPVPYVHEPGYTDYFNLDMFTLPAPATFTQIAKPDPAAQPGTVFFFDPIENYRCIG